MAKTKMWNDLNQALAVLDGTLNAVQNEIKSMNPITPQLRKDLWDHYTAFSAASGAMKTHLDNLQRREDTPTVTDRLRNLKNFFKDKQQLKQQRATYRTYFNNLQGRIDQLKNDSTTTLNGIEVHNMVAENMALQPRSASGN